MLPLPVPPVLGVDGIVELPPMPELEPEPVDGAVGLVVLDELPMPEPDAPEPALLRWSRRQSSRCAPVRPTHLLASLPDAPDDAPVAPDVLPEVDVLVSLELEDDAPVDGSVVLLPDDELLAGGVAEGVVALPEVELPLLDGEVVLLCANAAPESASNAAAVAAVSVFNII